MNVTQETIDSLDGLLEEHLEIAIVAQIADSLSTDVQTAMDLYYSSKLAQQISDGSYGLQYLNATVLVADLFENESELFSSWRSTKAFQQ